AVTIVPRGAVAGAEVDQVGTRVVENRIPHRAAAAELPPLPAPSRGRFLHRGVLEAVLRVARHRVEAPVELSRFRVVGAEVTAHPVFTAGLANEHLSLGNARCAGYRVVLALVDGQHGPGLFAGTCIDGHQAAIERPQIDLAVPRGDAAIDGAAADVADPLPRGLGV